MTKKSQARNHPQVTEMGRFYVSKRAMCFRVKQVRNERTVLIWRGLRSL